MREEACFEVEPHPLDRVQLRRIGRQRYQRDVGGYDQTTRSVPACLIEHHDSVVVRGQGRCKGIEELLHRLGVRVRHDEREAVIGAGFHGCENVGECEALVAKAGRALAAFPPHVAGSALLPDARLVLEEETNTLLFMRTLNFFQQCRGSF